jgi:hypothetical protein
MKPRSKRCATPEYLLFAHENSQRAFTEYEKSDLPKNQCYEKINCFLQARLIFDRFTVFIWKQKFRSSQWLRRLTRSFGAISAYEASLDSFFVIPQQICVLLLSLQVEVIICRHSFKNRSITLFEIEEKLTAQVSRVRGDIEQPLGLVAVLAKRHGWNTNCGGEHALFWRPCTVQILYSLKC